MKLCSISKSKKGDEGRKTVLYAKGVNYYERELNPCNCGNLPAINDNLPSTGDSTPLIIGIAVSIALCICFVLIGFKIYNDRAKKRYLEIQAGIKEEKPKSFVPTTSTIAAKNIEKQN